MEGRRERQRISAGAWQRSIALAAGAKGAKGEDGGQTRKRDGIFRQDQQDGQDWGATEDTERMELNREIREIRERG